MPTRSVPPSAVIAAPAHDATERQLAFIGRLATERQLDEDHHVWLRVKLNEGVSKRYASEIIERVLLARPKIDGTPPAGSSQASRAAVVFNSLPAGRYALTEPTDAVNPIRFYTVTIGKDGGRWEGFRFVERHASDERYPVKGSERERVLTLIIADPEAASKLYGRETNHCGVCGKELTRPESRAAGIGPTCAGKVGW